LAPSYVAVSTNHAVRRTSIESFLRVQRRVDAPEDHERAPLFYQTPDRIPPKSIPRMNADADDITGPNALYIQRFQGFITQDRVPEF
jgi:hypothetical protein